MPKKTVMKYASKFSIAFVLICASELLFAQTTVNFNVSQKPLPEADFGIQYMPNRTTFLFWDSSTTAITSWYWDFGDGANSNLQDVSHVYASLGIYNVCLAVSNDNFCLDTTCKEVNSFLGININSEFDKTVSVFPVPFRNEINVSVDLSEPGRLKITLHNVLGEEVLVLADQFCEEGLVSTKRTFNSAEILPPGAYHIIIRSDNKVAVRKVISN